ncbi:MAG: hypothetical protein HOA15_02820 [Candidatus Marinimicrobia bacterium]|jgi:5'-nucleotidase/UDP-sugar diphosphatase|nr:hypothetical protein [Candidatus Neomarinimicrobiota bacterium]MBT3675023.1 hypothetical protein [Candidatus Neomarinimicrobiota bacterium]MBT3764062.1 hypothetical protein [Candidatus Neomarinimicrobiota bacterium]MBT4069199.1 hypothetical protein [Candidatus Neomarinimicrobiota bacterium]MBT4270188.1 hypothetical protein [Candidatus Neomarinimicrobiota bacterium]
MMGHVKPSRFRLILAVFLTASIFAQEKILYILHTNNTNGALENCYCPDHPFGAVEKRTVFINNFISSHPNSILVDAGDMFTMTHQSFKDSLLAEAYGLLPYDAILPGDQELTMSPKQINRLYDMMNINVVGTNIFLEGVDNIIASHIVEKDGIKIAILGIMDPYAVKYYTPEQKDHIVLKDPVEAIKAEMEKLVDGTDIFILLTHQGADLDYALADKIEGLHVIVGSHSQSPLDKPEEVNGTLIVQAGKEGYYVGIAELIINGKDVVSKSGRIDTMKFEMPDDERVMNFIHEYEQKSGRINRRKLKEKE